MKISRILAAPHRADRKPLRIVDFNNHFSFQGGGIRTYHMHKLAHLAGRRDVSYSLIVPSDRDGTERHGRARVIHLRAPKIPGNAAYRLLVNPFKLKSVLKRLKPDVVEVGGPYVDPFLIRMATRGLDTVVSGFWHTHYPSAYFEYYGNLVSRRIGRLLERAGWALARKTYEGYEATFAAADCVISDLRDQGIERVIQCPLGTDLELFHPDRSDPELRRSIGAEDRPLLFFPHRLLPEKGVVELVEAVPAIAEQTGAVFAFAGVGPKFPLVSRLVRDRGDCHYLGYLQSPEEMARWYATSDLAFGLSAWETFGLSVVEAMASGTPVIGADKGAVRDWIDRSGCGVTVSHGDTEALIAATVSMLQRDDLDEVGRLGRRFAERHFSWGRTFERQLAHYRAMVRARRSGTVRNGYPYLLAREAA
jgi:alpha-1,6-mannosyltransferase